MSNVFLKTKEPKVTGHDGLKAVEVVNAGNKSITEKATSRIVVLNWSKK